jgi:hypothetical protein
MATGFSVFVNIGGKVDPSLAGAVAAAKSQVNSLATSLASIGKGVNAQDIAAEVERGVYRVFAKLESNQRGLLSD